jgi:ribosomal-protein-alanine N-acetyltransferase
MTSHQVTIPTLHTERLILRAWRSSDLPPFMEMSADAELMRFVGGAMDAPNAFRRMAYYAGQWIIHGYGGFALEHRTTGELIGYSGINDPSGFPEREINWGVRRAYLGQGYATEAATAVRAYAYETLGFPFIASCIDPDNDGSLAVAKRLGCTLSRMSSFAGRPIGVWRHIPPENLRGRPAMPA